jgi:hypothetical protein
MKHDVLEKKNHSELEQKSNEQVQTLIENMG